MAISTYAELKSAIADWLNRSDLDAVIPTFIALAEAQFNREFRHRKMVTRATATLDTSYFAVPADWLQTIRFQVDTNPPTPLLFLTPDTLADYATAYTAANTPMYFTMVGQQFQVLPAPSGSPTGELTYYAKIPALSDTVASNWLLTEAPDLYLYGALVQSAPYIKEDERVATWSALYTKLSEDMKLADERARIGSSRLQIKVRPF